MSKIYNYQSKLAKPMEEYIAQKRALGRKYDKESKIFYEFDVFLHKHSLQDAELPRSIVEDWITKRPNEKRKNQLYRLNFTKRFVHYLHKNGYTAYLPNLTITASDDNDFVPYIFRNDELAKLLAYFNNMKPSRQYPNGHLVLPLLFRTLACCGLRVSEATNLKLKDVNLTNGVLLIREAKNDKKRYVPMSESLTNDFIHFYAAIHKCSEQDDYFFPNARKGAYASSHFYDRFREALWHCGIEHKGRGYGPRVHDLRHTFAVRCMQKFDKNKKDIVLSLPYLSAYLGHYDISKTQKYLHLIAEHYPEIIEKQCEYLGDTIPVWEVRV